VVRSAYQAAAQLGDTLLHEGLRRWSTLPRGRPGPHGRRLFHQRCNRPGQAGAALPDPHTVFKGPLGISKQAAWSDPIPLDEVKAIGKATGCTVNDVLLTAMSGALRHYLLQRGQAVEGLNIRAVVPVNLRPLDVFTDLGNKFGLVFLSLPVGIENTRQRLRELKRRMDALKGTPEAVVAFGVLNMMGMAPTEIQDLVVNIFQTKATAVMTNVPGPRQTRYLAGAPLDTIMFWVPQSGHLGLGISIFSYAGRVWLGVASDQGLVPNPQTITAAFHKEFDQMKAMAGKAEKQSTRHKLDEMKALLDQALADLDEVATRRDE
jgi:WS/DGAT/MGAT family acyltransferase